MQMKGTNMHIINSGHTRVDPRWQVTENAAAGFCRLYSCNDGRAYYSSGKEKIAVEAGNIYLFPTTVPYALRRDEVSPLECTWVHLDFSPWRNAQTLVIPQESSQFLVYWIEAVRSAMEEKESSTIVEQLGDTFHSYCMDHHLLRGIVPRFENVLRYITENYCQEINIHELSHLVSYSPQYFIQTFREDYGQTPYQYIISLRMRKAVQLLQQGLAVESIAGQVGYPDDRSFRRRFRGYYGVSPSNYIKNYQAIP